LPNGVAQPSHTSKVVRRANQIAEEEVMNQRPQHAVVNFHVREYKLRSSGKHKYIAFSKIFTVAGLAH
jgi:hypothetical protein